MRPPIQRVLYVEDEPDIRAIAVLALETVGGLSVRACPSGAEALEAAPVFRPDLLLLDVMMPEMDGVTALRELRKLPATCACPVVFMTAKVQPDEVRNLKSLGALEVIAKPFDPMTLAVTLQAIWAQQEAA